MFIQGEDKDFGDKWEQISDEKSSKFTNHLEDSQHSHHLHLNYNNNHSSHPIFQSNVNHQKSQQYNHHLPDEVSLDSLDNPEGSNTASTSSGSASSQTESKEATSFLFVGPLGKKRKYSRQRATSDDNETEAHSATLAGSPEMSEDMDNSPSPGDNSQQSTGQPTCNDSPSHTPPHRGSEPVSTIVRTPPPQRTSSSPESCGESLGENSNMTGELSGTADGITPITKPTPIGAPTSVIRRVSRKKQEHPLPLNLSVSSPPSISQVAHTSSNRQALSRVAEGLSPTNANAIQDEHYYDGRSESGDRQVFVWRYREDVTAPTALSNAVAGPISPSSTISATSFGRTVPDVGGSKIGSSGASSSASSAISQLRPGSHGHQIDQDIKAETGTCSGASNASGGKAPKRKLKCQDCGKEFSQLRNYRYHRSRHEGSDQFSCTCPVCGKQFNDRGYLSSHMKIHRNAKEYRCEYCTKGFNQRVAYNMHRRIHTGHRPHQCEVCGKSFSRRMLLKQHMRIHTGERPYSCGVCNKAFADRSNMLLHQRLHSGERPYVCEVCKKSFSKNHHLKTHMNHHAGIKPYECPKCHARFSQSSNMKTHLKKCSGVPNPTTSQRQQMLRRNPLDIGRPTAQLPNLPSLPGVVAAAAAAAAGRGGEALPPLTAASRLIYEQQSLSFLSQSINSGTLSGAVGGPTSIPPQLSPGRGQMPIESLLLHLNVGRSRHPSQGSMHSGAPESPTSSMSIPDLQMMLRNAAVVAAATSSASRSISQNQSQRPYSSPSSPGSSSNQHAANLTASGMTPGMATFGESGLHQAINVGRRGSPPQGNINPNNNEMGSPQSPMMSMNANMGLVGYGIGNSGRGFDSSVMPPPTTNGHIRNPASNMIPAELLSPTSANMLRIDTRNIDGYPSSLSPPDKTGRQGRTVPSPLVSPRRKEPSPTSLAAGGSFIPLSTLETAAIASGLKSPSQVVRFLSSALREAESQQANQSPSYTRLPSLSHHNVLEAMVAAAAAEQNAPPSQATITRVVRQSPPPSHLHHHYQVPSQAQSFHYADELSNYHSHERQPGAHHQSHHGAAPSSPFSVITSSHLLQQDQALNIQQPNARYSSSASRSTIDDRHHSHAADQHAQQVELHHHQQQPPQTQRSHGYHQSLLLNHVSQGGVSQSPSSGYSSGSPGNSNSNSSYSAFSHSIIRSRSHSPTLIDHLRGDRNQDYQN